MNAAHPALFLVYFVAGVAAGVAGVFAWAFHHEERQEKKKPSRWKSIERVEFTWRFPWEVESTTTLKEIVEATPLLMKNQLERKPIAEAGITEVLPGKYTVDLRVVATFTERD